MKRIAVFAHFDSQNKIEDYVLFYLKELKKFCDNLIFSSASIPDEKEIEKLGNIADIILCEEHGEYDFGSYKRGFFEAKKRGLLENADELIFANDSCYGPIKPLDKMFDQMEKEDCDFWAITRNKYGIKKTFTEAGTDVLHSVVRPHLQSYFLVFRQNVFVSKDFEDFISHIRSLDKKYDIVIEYEIGLSEFLWKKGFKSSTFIKKYYRVNNPLILAWRELLVNTDMQFVKRSIFKLDNRFHTTIEHYEEVMGDYPLELLGEVKYSHKAPYIVKRMIFSLIQYLPYHLRCLCSALIEHVFILVAD